MKCLWSFFKFRRQSKPGWSHSSLLRVYRLLPWLHDLHIIYIPVQFAIEKSNQKARVLQAALLMFALSVVSWLLDNYQCTRLRHLPGGIPYPHLHTWWHVFIAVTLHCIMVLLHMDSYRHSAHLDLRFLAGLPVVHA